MYSPEMKKKLQAGVSLVVDRYAFSGVAFTSAKQVHYTNINNMSTLLYRMIVYLSIKHKLI